MSLPSLGSESSSAPPSYAQLLVQLVDQATAAAQRDPVSKADLGGAVKAVCELVSGPTKPKGLGMCA